MPTSGISRRVSAISRFMSSMLTGQAHSGNAQLRTSGSARRPCASTRARPRRRSRRALPRSSAGGGRSSAGSPPGCGRAARARPRAPRATATRSCSVSPIPTRIPLVNGILSSPAASIVSRRRAGCFVGEPACTVCISRSDTDSSISPCEAVTSRSRARSSRESTPRLVCGNRPRSSARSHVQTT